MLHSTETQAFQETYSPHPGIVVYSGSTISGDGNAVFSFHLGDHCRRALSPRIDLKRISTEGFYWGTDSPGAEQLSLALLCDVLDNDPRALRLCSPLCNLMVRHLPRSSDWMLADSDIRAAVHSIETVLGWNWVEKFQCYADELPV